MALESYNPTTGELVERFDEHSDEEVDRRLSLAEAAFRSHRRTPFPDRQGLAESLAATLEARADDLAATMTNEMGKPLSQAKAEVAKCARALRFYAANAESMLRETPTDASAVGAGRAYTRWEPLGPVLAVMPWNFPLWQVIRFAAPAVMAGNVCLVKHASNVSRTALALEAAFAEAGFPPGVFQVLLIGSKRVEAVLRDPRVAAVTLTGSTPAGAAVASVAGAVIKPAVLELGGSDPFIVMASADLDRAADVAVASRCQNNGQSCIAAKRFIVHRDVLADFTERFVARMKSLVVGDPMKDGTDVGPLATAQVLADVEDYVADAVSKGARVLLGGKRPLDPGWFYAPTVLEGVTKEAKMFAEEVFGPVAQVHCADDIDQAAALANATPFGLGSNVWTADPAEAEYLIGELRAGSVFVNGMTASYPQLPFGGVKSSGFGRELAAVGPQEFCNLKTVWVGDTGS